MAPLEDRVSEPQQRGAPASDIGSSEPMHQGQDARASDGRWPVLSTERVVVQAPDAPWSPARMAGAELMPPTAAMLPTTALVAERPAAEAGSTVVVTIGRIEVRAAPPPAPAPPPQPRKTASVSLEEYLQPRRRSR